MLLYMLCHCRGHFENLIQYHERLVIQQVSPRRSAGGPHLQLGQVAQQGFVANHLLAPALGNLGGKFPQRCWSMALCQAIAIAMNMSLTPLANQIAQGSFDLTQKVVLVKLLSDCVGRCMFLIVVPTPDRDSPLCTLRSLRCHSALVWLLQLFRLILWVCVYLRAIQHPSLSILANETVLLYVVWLPLISLGAFSSSWCCVVASTAARAEQRASVNTLMTTSIYAGYVIGIATALCSGG
jgi:hypothetical protein